MYFLEGMRKLYLATFLILNKCMVYFLNICHTGATALTNSYFGVGFRHQFMQVTSCLGSESLLLSCSHTSLGSDPSCNALNEVGVRCIGMLATSLLT